MVYIPLAFNRKRHETMAGKLSKTRPRYTNSLEGKRNMFKHAMVSTEITLVNVLAIGVGGRLIAFACCLFNYLKRIGGKVFKVTIIKVLLC